MAASGIFQKWHFPKLVAGGAPFGVWFSKGAAFDFGLFSFAAHSQRSPVLCAMPDRADNHALPAYSIKYRVRRSPDNQLANSRLRSDSPQVRVHPQSLNHRDNSCSQVSCSFGFVQRDESTNFPQPCSRQRRPNDLYRHSASSSWYSPQTHFGGGSSRSVPQESSHAFMSSCLT